MHCWTIWCTFNKHIRIIAHRPLRTLQLLRLIAISSSEEGINWKIAQQYSQKLTVVRNQGWVANSMRLLTHHLGMGQN